MQLLFQSLAAFLGLFQIENTSMNILSAVVGDTAIVGKRLCCRQQVAARSDHEIKRSDGGGGYEI